MVIKYFSLHYPTIIFNLPKFAQVNDFIYIYIYMRK